MSEKIKTSTLSPSEVYEVALTKFGTDTDKFNSWIVMQLEATVEARTKMFFALSEYRRAIEATVEAEDSGRIVNSSNYRNVVEAVAKKHGLSEETYPEFKQRLNTYARAASDMAYATLKYRKYFLMNF